MTGSFFRSANERSAIQSTQTQMSHVALYNPMPPDIARFQLKIVPARREDEHDPLFMLQSGQVSKEDLR